MESDVKTWRRVWEPRNLAAPSVAEAPRHASNLVLEAALDDLTNSVNLSTGLGHANDRAKAVSLFRILRKARERVDPEDVRVWAQQHGWHPTHAQELADIAAGVYAGRRYHVGQATWWRKDILDRWRGKEGRHDAT